MDGPSSAMAPAPMPAEARGSDAATRSSGMRFGMAILLALAVAAGLWLGTRPPPGLLEGLGILLLLLALARRRPPGWLPLVALAWVAAGLLLARGAILPDGLLREDLAIEGRLVSVTREERLTRLTLAVTRCAPWPRGAPAATAWSECA